MGQRRCLGEEWGSDLVVKLQFQRCLEILVANHPGRFSEAYIHSFCSHLFEKVS